MQDNINFLNDKSSSNNEDSIVNPFESAQKLATDQGYYQKKADQERYKMILNIVKNKQYEDFISKRDNAFIYYSLKPETKHLFPQEDIESVDQLMFNYNGSIIQVYTFSCIGTAFIDRLLRRKNLIYGLTYKPSTLRFLVKYFIIPNSIANLAKSNYLQSKYKNQLSKIYQKYDFNQEIFRNSYASELQSKNQVNEPISSTKSKSTY